MDSKERVNVSLCNSSAGDCQTTPTSESSCSQTPSQENPITGISRRQLLRDVSIATAGMAAFAAAGTQHGAAQIVPPNENLSHLLTGKNALVTGAARGIGRAISLALASAGANIVGF